MRLTYNLGKSLCIEQERLHGSVWSWTKWNILVIFFSFKCFWLLQSLPELCLLMDQEASHASFYFVGMIYFGRELILHFLSIWMTNLQHAFFSITNLHLSHTIKGFGHLGTLSIFFLFCHFPEVPAIAFINQRQQQKMEFSYSMKK